MAVKVGINGFGRIGRNVLRASLGNPEIDYVAVNDLTSPATLAHLLKYDSILGNLKNEIKAGEDFISVDGKKIKVFAEKDPAKLPWADVGAQIVLESTGRFTEAADAKKHLGTTVKKVIISAPAKNEDMTIVLGVNQNKYDPAKHHILSNASCTTNCLAPLAKVLHDAFGVKRGLMTTVHATTATQKTVDGPSNKDWRGGRGILENIIPSSTGAAKAVGKVIPALNKKLTGMSFRVPTSDVSVVDLTCELAREATFDQVVVAMKAAAEGPLKGVLAVTSDKVVSTDFRGESCTCVFDVDASIMLDPTFLKAVAWYDNEWGYSCKVLEMVRVMARR